jgi:murein DD-endopeptidase MepM/ murein hydrolase activator NlpD
MKAPAEAPREEKTAGDYLVTPFPGGDVHVRLTTDGTTVSEWMTNDFAIPVALAIERKTTLLTASTPPLRAVVLAPKQATRVAAWRIDDARNWNEHSDIELRLGDPHAKSTPYIYALPFSLGESHRLMQGFNSAFSHNGGDAYALDFEMPEGTPIRAARDGVVVAYNDQATTNGLTPEFKDMAMANWIVVLHGDNTLGEYWHLQPHGVSVKIGQRVARGDVIGLSGWTGFSTSPHLHFEVQTAADGLNAKSFPFALAGKPDEAAGEDPVEDRVYTAFE